nr:energy transducer TonB [Ectothiorhodospira sp. 9100]
MARLREAIARKRHYPDAARNRGIEGTVIVSFVMHRSGRINNIRVAQGSGNDAIDRAAVEAVGRASPFDNFPKEIDRDHWPMQVPISFRLQ